MEKPIIIGISGGSGSGKTSIINELKNEFQEEICFVSQDDFYKPIEEQLVDQKGITNFDLPNAIDDRRLIDTIKELQHGHEVEIEEYTFNNPNATPKKIKLKPAPIILIEGVFIFHYPLLKDLFQLKVFVEASDALKIIRRIKRDKIERNYPLEDVLYRYEHHVLPAYKTYIEPYIQEMDIIIKNEIQYNKGLSLLRAYIATELTKQ